MKRKWPDLCETLLGKLEAVGVDTTAEREEFAVLYAECCVGGCGKALSQKGVVEDGT